MSAKKRGAPKRAAAKAAKEPKKAAPAAKAAKPQRAPKASALTPSVTAALLDRLVQDAKAARERAYAPYSRYFVGAAIATKSGRVFAGCNVENASYGATICAERGAIMQMVAAGEQDPIACAVVTSDGGSPCGICRQVLAEFARDMPVALVGLDTREGETGRVVQLAELLPLAFELAH
jgi:cytidine deaminase